MLAVLTGSHAYGTPRPDSDVDLVVLVGREGVDKLSELADETGVVSCPGGQEKSLRFGKLNLSPARLESWRKATAELVARKPVTRDEAVRLLDQAFAEEEAAMLKALGVRDVSP